MYIIVVTHGILPLLGYHLETTIEILHVCVDVVTIEELVDVYAGQSKMNNPNIFTQFNHFSKQERSV